MGRWKSAKCVFDSNILIYFVENDEEFGLLATQALAKAIDTNGAAFSVLALTELLSHKQTPAQLKKLAHLERVVQFIDVSREVARRAGGLRATHPTLRTPDAIHLATALVCKASRFITNDVALGKTAKSITKITRLLQ